MATRILHGSTSFEQFWQRTIQGLFIWSFNKIGQTVSEEMSFKAIVGDARRTIHDARRTPDVGQRPITIAHMSTSWLGELKMPRTTPGPLDSNATSLKCACVLCLFFILSLFLRRRRGWGRVKSRSIQWLISSGLVPLPNGRDVKTSWTSSDVKDKIRE